MKSSENKLNKFSSFMKERCGVENKERVLVGLSGGADSVALLHLLIKNNYNCEAAHCNFSLRGQESDEDEIFVKDLCEKWKIKLHCIKFDTYTYSKLHKISIEMAARELRYNWFDQLLKTTGIKHLATGHHGSDAIETFFLNLVRGTGIKGLKGIAWRNKHVIRPLLEVSSNDVLNYCQSNNLKFRTDSSNLETHYHRNKIRQDIIPVLEEINPSFFDTMQNNMAYLQEVEQILHAEIQRVKKQMVAETGEGILIPLKLINEHPQKQTILYEILRPYGFSGSIIKSVINSLAGIPGKQFFSPSHRLVIDRYNLILVANTQMCNNSYTIEGGQKLISEPLKLELRQFKKTENYSFSKENWKAHLDADLIDFPLTLRKAETGDRFQPLGMQQFKKISDFFIDKKMSLIDKEKTWLLTTNSDIIWIVGHRIDDRYKITTRTKNILEIVLPNSICKR